MIVVAHLIVVAYLAAFRIVIVLVVVLILDSFGMILCPEGANKTQPGVSTPGTDHQRVKPERAPGERPGTRTHKIVPSRPFRANRLTGRFPGLKPWAEFFSPFGAARWTEDSTIQAFEISAGFDSA
jgi:hypothetical protein